MYNTCHVILSVHFFFLLNYVSSQLKLFQAATFAPYVLSPQKCRKTPKGFLFDLVLSIYPFCPTYIELLGKDIFVFNFVVVVSIQTCWYNCN